MLKSIFNFILVVVLVLVVLTVAFGQEVSTDAAPAASSQAPVDVIDFSKEQPAEVPDELRDIIQNELGLTPKDETPTAANGSKSIPVSELKRTSDTAPEPATTTTSTDEIIWSDGSVKESAEPAEPEPFFFANDIEAAEMVKPLPTRETELAARGVIGISELGLGADIWAGQTVDEAQDMIDTIVNGHLHNPVARQLFAQLLLTEAEPPNDAGIEWLAIRANALQQIGLAGSARLLLVGVDDEQAAADPLLAKVWVSDRLLHQRPAEACPLVQSYLLTSQSPWWRRALLTCQLMQNQGEALRLSLDITKDEELTEAPAFFAYLNSIQHGDAIQLSPTKPTLLEAVVLRMSPALATNSQIQQLPDSTLRQIRDDSEFTSDVRLAAAEALAAIYPQPDDITRLHELYSAVELPAAAEAVTAAEAEPIGALARARLWQAAVNVSNDNSVRALALQALWSRASAEELDSLNSALLPSSVKLPARTNEIWLAPAAIRYSLLAGDIEQAEDWAKLLANTRADNPDLLAAQQNYALVFSLLNNNLRLEALRNWWKIQPDQAAALRIVTVLEGAGLAIPPEFWLEIQNNFDDSVVPQGQGPGPLWLRLVAQSLEWNESGRALLTLITPLAQIGPAELNATGISNLLAGLRYLQREDAAKALALHALLDVTE